MKKLIRNISLLTVVSGALLTSCKKDFLNTKPLNQASSATTWSDPNLSEAFVTELYNGMNAGFLSQMNFDCQTDNALYNFGKQSIMESNINPDNGSGEPNGTTDWNDMYARIRSANISLTQLATAPIDKTLADRLTGEALFMRAYFYNQLLRYYGGVPLVTKVYDASATDFTIARSSYSDCVDFIVNDLDKAAGLLQGKPLAQGRATSDACLALKARVLLYAASDLHDMPTAKAKSSLLAGYAHPELLGYIDGDRGARWKKAQDAAKAVMDLGKYGYMLTLSAPTTAAAGQTNYQNIYLSRGGGEAEMIFGRYIVNAKDDGGD